MAFTVIWIRSFSHLDHMASSPIFIKPAIQQSESLTFCRFLLVEVERS